MILMIVDNGNESTNHSIFLLKTIDDVKNLCMMTGATNKYTKDDSMSDIFNDNDFTSCMKRKTLTERERAALFIQFHFRQYMKKSEEEFLAYLEMAAKEAQENYRRMNDADRMDLLPSSEPYKNTDARKNFYIDYLLDCEMRNKLGQEHDFTISATIENQNKCSDDYASIRDEDEEKEYSSISPDEIEDIMTDSNVTETSGTEADEVYCSLPADIEAELAAIMIQIHYKHHFRKRVIAAKTIQFHYRIYKSSIMKRETSRSESTVEKLPEIIETGKQRQKYLSNDEAATVIQKQYRSHITKKLSKIRTKMHSQIEIIPEENEECNGERIDDRLTAKMAAILIQMNYRKHYQQRLAAAKTIQSHYRLYNTVLYKRNVAEKSYEEQIGSDDERKEENIEKCSVKLDEMIHYNTILSIDSRNSNVEKNLPNKNQCHSNIEILPQKQRASNNVNKKINSDLGRISMINLEEEFLPELAAIVIQKYYRPHLQKRMLAAKCIQSVFRSYREMLNIKQRAANHATDNGCQEYNNGLDEKIPPSLITIQEENEYFLTDGLEQYESKENTWSCRSSSTKSVVQYHNHIKQSLSPNLAAIKIQRSYKHYYNRRVFAAKAIQQYYRSYRLSIIEKKVSQFTEKSSDLVKPEKFQPIPLSNNGSQEKNILTLEEAAMIIQKQYKSFVSKQQKRKIRQKGHKATETVSDSEQSSTLKHNDNSNYLADGTHNELSDEKQETQPNEKRSDSFYFYDTSKSIPLNNKGSQDKKISSIDEAAMIIQRQYKIHMSKQKAKIANPTKCEHIETVKTSKIDCPLGEQEEINPRHLADEVNEESFNKLSNNGVKDKKILSLHDAANIIQQQYKRHLKKQKAETLNDAACKIECTFSNSEITPLFKRLEGIKSKHDGNEKCSAEFPSGDFIKKKLLSQDEAAVIIQKQYKNHIQRQKAVSINLQNCNVMDTNDDGISSKQKPPGDESIEKNTDHLHHPRKEYNDLPTFKFSSRIPKPEFEQKWPATRRQIIKNRDLHQKKKENVRTSLDKKREERRNDKKKRLDKCHSHKIKQIGKINENKLINNEAKQIDESTRKVMNRESSTIIKQDRSPREVKEIKVTREMSGSSETLKAKEVMKAREAIKVHKATKAKEAIEAQVTLSVQEAVDEETSKAKVTVEGRSTLKRRRLMIESVTEDSELAPLQEYSSDELNSPPEQEDSKIWQINNLNDIKPGRWLNPADTNRKPPSFHPVQPPSFLPVQPTCFNTSLHKPPSSFHGNPPQQLPSSFHGNTPQQLPSSFHGNTPQQPSSMGHVNAAYNEYCRPGRHSSELTASSPTFSPSRKAASIGTLDSYTVQKMLKRNELETKNRNDSRSYLHTHLKKNQSGNSPKLERKNSNVIKPRITPRPGYSDTLSGNLDRISKYGKSGRFDRKKKPDEWKTFVDNAYPGLKEQQDVSRGAFYPVIPSYGRMRSGSSNDTLIELGETEIPWPSDPLR